MFSSKERKYFQLSPSVAPAGKQGYPIKFKEKI